MSASDMSTFVELLLAGGLGTAVTEVTRRFRGPKIAKLDVAARVQEAALGLIEPLEKRAKTAEDKADRLAEKFDELTGRLDEILVWAKMAKRELDAHQIVIPPIPIRRGMNGAAS